MTMLTVNTYVVLTLCQALYHMLYTLFNFQNNYYKIDNTIVPILYTGKMRLKISEIDK